VIASNAGIGLGEVHRVVEPEAVVIAGLEAGEVRVHRPPVLGAGTSSIADGSWKLRGWPPGSMAFLLSYTPEAGIAILG
jgi:hypothetical protein